MMNGPTAGTMKMTSQTQERSNEPRPLLPFLEPFYRSVVPLAWQSRCAAAGRSRSTAK
jgi:hypothetical protein